MHIDQYVYLFFIVVEIFFNPVRPCIAEQYFYFFHINKVIALLFSLIMLLDRTFGYMFCYLLLLNKIAIHKNMTNVDIIIYVICCSAAK